MIIDVIIPVYNGAKYIKRCIESVIDNAFLCKKKATVKITVINDGSTDNTDAILQQLRRKYKQLTIYEQPNSGAGAARNLGIESTEGDYIVFLDADDWLPENALLNLAGMALDTQADAVFGKHSYCVGNYPVNSIVSGGLIFHQSGIINQYDDYFLARITPGIRAKMFKRSLFKHLRFPKERIKWEDLAVIPALLARADRIAYVNKCIYFYSAHFNTTVHDFLFRCDVFDIFRSLRILKENLIDIWRYDEFCKEYRSMLTMHVLFRVENVVTWVDTSKAKKDKLIKSILDRLTKLYPNWRDDPILTDPEKKIQDSLFWFRIKKYL